jgi:hypothetical protein
MADWFVRIGGLVNGGCTAGRGRAHSTSTIGGLRRRSASGWWSRRAQATRFTSASEVTHFGSARERRRLCACVAAVRACAGCGRPSWVGWTPDSRRAGGRLFHTAAAGAGRVPTRGK